MAIVIDDNKTIEEVQSAFSEEYPYLKIEFITSPQKKASSSSRSEIIPRQKKLGTIRENHSSGVVSVEPEKTVRELLDVLNRDYGLRAQVYRKFGHMWIETGLTSHWSLSLQNSEGLEISQAFVKK